MSLFSQRKGYKGLQKEIQREQIDDDLKNKLWSVLNLLIWDRWGPPDLLGRQPTGCDDVENMVVRVWLDFFKWPTDTIPVFKASYGRSAFSMMREFFYSCNWWEIYDFVEFIMKNLPTFEKEAFRSTINNVLQSESGAYRIIGEEIVEITDEHEINSLETALQRSVGASKEHLKSALALLADRVKPDYRNSIKESISAVESICQQISGKPKGTLGEYLKDIKDSHKLHPAFEQALLKLYGFTSDAGGIRHALTDSAEIPTFAEAKFMLVSCAAFCNYLLTLMSVK